MILSLLSAIVISLFALGAGVMLLLRFRDWRFGFLTGLAVFAASWVLANQLVQLSAEAGGVAGAFETDERAFPTLALSIMALSVMFFLERIIRKRSEAEEISRLAQVSLERISIPIFWVTSTGRIHHANKGACAFLGYRHDELLSMTIHDLAPLYLAGERCRDWAALEKRGSINVELTCCTKDGELVPVDVTAIHVGSQDRDLACLFVRDITERKRAETDLHVAMAKVEGANKAKSQFLAAMSHELRTPLNAIIGFSEIIKEEVLGPADRGKYRGYAQDIYDSGQHLLAIINEILDLSKIESGAAELHERCVEIPGLVRSVLMLVEQRAQDGEVRLGLEIADDLPALLADERKLTQVLVNLLSNGIKFTKPGGTVRLRAWSRADSGFVIQVADTGIGIAAEDVPKALSQFSQIDSDLNRKYDGTGLGLPLSKALIELHGGSFDLQSRLGVGTTVTMRFPPDRLIRADTQAPARATA